MVTIASVLSTLVFVWLGVAPSLVSSAAAQGSQTQQFVVTIKQRKVASANDLISVTKGDAVEIVLTSDEAAELHLHGYDLLVSLSPNVPGKIQFTANIAGRFSLEAHRYGTGPQTGRSHSGRPLLYVEVHPR
jgi:FtsP/CotA-like multicopper oxidase with cupredoxin domain